MSNNDPVDEPVDHGQVVSHPGVRISWAWVFPILAAAAAGWLFWSNWKSKGPEIEIEFQSAPGIQAGKTPLVYRGVTVGAVTAARLDRELDKVILVVQLKEFAAELAREGSVFWVEKPVVGLADTSGLEALIQGNSLQVRMGDGPPARRFIGVDRAPLTPLESPTLILHLRAPRIPFLDRGSALFYRGVQVGMVEDKALDEKGAPYLRVMVEKEFAETVRSNARFWPVSATSIRVGPSGVKLDMLGLKTILLGGVEFDVFGEPGDAVADGAEFTLYPDGIAARATGAPVQIVFQNGEGLRPGETEVRHLGVPVGFVEAVNLNTADGTVTAVAHFQPAYEHLHSEGAVFTLVRPHISLDGVSGLETILSGVYIDCVPGSGSTIATSFQGLTLSDEGLLTVQEEREAIPLTLRAKTLPPVGIGAPVLYRGVVAGRVKSKVLGPDQAPVLGIVIRKDFADALPRNARFWHLPGASVQAGPGLLNIDIAGIQTLLQGGVAFDVFGEPEGTTEPGTTFKLFETEVAARAISPPIRITFENGQGLLAGRTQVRHLGLPVGIVEAVNTKDGRVEAVVRLNEGCDFLRREGSDFAIVRLDVSLEGVSGLETVVSGVYIECVPAASGRLIDHFTGVSPVVAAFDEEEEKGLEIVVTAAQTNIGVDAPVTYRGLVVGKVGRKILLPGGRGVGLCVVIDSTHAGLIRENTRFWDAGGVKVSLGFLGLKVQTSSLESLARGGLAFATPGNAEMGAAVRHGHEFELHDAPRREWLRWAPTIPAAD